VIKHTDKAEYVGEDPEALRVPDRIRVVDGHHSMGERVRRVDDDEGAATWPAAVVKPGLGFWARGARGLKCPRAPPPPHIKATRPSRSAPLSEPSRGVGVQMELLPQTDLRGEVVFEVNSTPSKLTKKRSPLSMVRPARGRPHAALGPWWSTSRI
jgi:hypothetical protein